MLGQPVSMLIPEVVGFKLTGRMVEGTTATDLVLKVVQMLRKKGVVEQVRRILRRRASTTCRWPTGRRSATWRPSTAPPAASSRSTARRCATCARPAATRRGSRWSRPMPRRTACGAGRTTSRSTPTRCTSTWARSSRRSPGRSGRRTTRRSNQAADAFYKTVADYRGIDVSNGAEKMGAEGGGVAIAAPPEVRKTATVEGEDYTIRDGSVVIAAITSCTNTSNPYVMIGAGLVARKARALGLTRKPWVKTSLAPGSQVVSEYLEAAGPAGGPRRHRLQPRRLRLHHLHRQLRAARAIRRSPRRSPTTTSWRPRCCRATATSRAGSRPDVRANYLAIAAAGRRLCARRRRQHRPDAPSRSASGKDGKDVYLKDIWPTNEEIADLVERTVTREAFQSKYADVFKGDEKWQAVETVDSETYDWPPTSTYIQNPPYFQGMAKEPGVISDITGARILALLGDMVTTDHISPGGLVQADDAGRRVPDRAADRAARLQLLRLAARQPRGDDARHLRQHPHQERDAGRGRGRLHPRAGRRADLDLRRLDGLPGRRACRWW